MTSFCSARARLKSAATAAGTGLLAFGLLAGIPWVLWRAVGVPWPERVLSWQDLSVRVMEPVSDPMMLELLALAGWVCWGAFAWTVVREASWYVVRVPQLLRDRSVHDRHVAELSKRRALAALCVGTMVMALLGLWRPHTVTQQAASFGELRPQMAVTALAVPASMVKDQHIEYVVVEGDTLWEVAATHLGDPLKWPRIYKLSKDRLQPDGGQLTDPDEIRPGWRLTIPVVRPLPEPPPAPAPSASERPSPPSVQDEKDTPSHAQAEARRQTDRGGSAAVSVGEAGLIGITTAVGLLVAVRFLRVHRNRSRRPGAVAHQPELKPVITRATSAAREATLPSTPVESEALVTRRVPPRQPQPPHVVTIGHIDGEEVALDVLAQPGGYDWGGPGAEAAARAVLCGVLTATERRRPAQPHVRAVVHEELADRLLPGLPPLFSALTQADVPHAVRLAEEHLVAHARCRELGEGADSPGTLLLLASPEPAYLGQFEALAARADADALIVLTLDSVLRGSERWHILTDGSVTTPDSGRAQELRLFQLTAEAARDVIEVVLGAHGQHARPRLIPAERTETASPPADEPGDADEEKEPAPTAPVPKPYSVESSRPEQRKPIRLHVLGPVTLYARGITDPVGVNMRAEVREFLALLAAHPAGLLASDISQHLRLDGDTEQNARELKNLRRAIRRVLRPVTGVTQQEFILLQGELHKLHPELVETDLADFIAAVSKATSAEEPEARSAAVREVLLHYRGAFAHGGDHPWADGIREHLATKATDAVLRLAHHAEHTGNSRETDAALAALEHVIALHPDHEQLYQHAIRLHQSTERHDAAQLVYTRLQRHLAELGLEPDAATQALLASRTRRPSSTLR